MQNITSSCLKFKAIKSIICYRISKIKLYSCVFLVVVQLSAVDDEKFPHKNAYCGTRWHMRADMQLLKDARNDYVPD